MTRERRADAQAVDRAITPTGRTNDPSDPSTRAGVPAVSFEDVGRSFSGVAVLRHVTLQAYAGRILALVGENGAGKSTLMNILGGNLSAATGRMRVAGEPYAPRTPQDARTAGIAFVHQELNLFGNLNVAENLHVQAFPLRAGLPWIDRSVMVARSAALLAQVGLPIAPDTPLERLSAGERQLVEIARALGARARVLILDEPTTSLSAPERERLFTLMRELRDRGLTIVYISHDLGDVLRLSDDVAVLRDGEVVAQGRAAELSVEQLVAAMIGRQVTQLFPKRTAGRGLERNANGDIDTARPLLEVQAITEPDIVHDVTFALHRREVLGLFGLMGAGRSELARILFGLDTAASGEVRLDGRLLTGGPRRRMQRGLAFVTEDRRHDGLCLNASVSDNVILATLAACCRTPARVVDEGRLRAAVRGMRDAVRLSATSDEQQPVRTLSGGNQQKVVLARWLLAAPRVLILDEPTRGVDIEARAEIYQLVRELADRGAGVLVISSDIEELIGLCDRILVMRHGALSGEFLRDDEAGSGRLDRENRGERGPEAKPFDSVGFDRARLLTAALPAGLPVSTPAASPHAPRPGVRT